MQNLVVCKDLKRVKDHQLGLSQIFELLQEWYHRYAWLSLQIETSHRLHGTNLFFWCNITSVVNFVIIQYRYSGGITLKHLRHLCFYIEDAYVENCSVMYNHYDVLNDCYRSTFTIDEDEDEFTGESLFLKQIHRDFISENFSGLITCASVNHLKKHQFWQIWKEVRYPLTMIFCVNGETIWVGETLTQLIENNDVRKYINNA